MHSAKPLGRLDTVEAPHRPDPLFDASMVLLQMIIQVAVRAMVHSCPQLGFDRAACASPLIELTLAGLTPKALVAERGSFSSFSRISRLTVWTAYPPPLLDANVY